MRNKKPTPKKPLTKYLLVYSIITVFIITLFIIAARSANKQYLLKKSTEEMANNMRETGLTPIEVSDGCQPDPNVKFSSKELCGITLKYSYVNYDSPSLYKRFEQIKSYLQRQIYFSLNDSFEENITKGAKGVFTYANLTEKQTGSKCQVSFGYGIGVIEADTLRLTLWCSK